MNMADQTPGNRTHYLEMTSPDAIRPKPAIGGLRIEYCALTQYPLNRFLYETVGGDWQWTDKLRWSNQQWQEYVDDPRLHTWLATSGGNIAGYYELQQQAEGNVEIAYFGLTPLFQGKGFGGALLTHALQSAWAWPETKRVWVHTCTLDHPLALANYQARGMTLYKTIREPPAE